MEYRLEDPVHFRSSETRILFVRKTIKVIDRFRHQTTGSLTRWGTAAPII